MVYKTRAKVISGFILAIFLVVSVCAVTYFSVKKLLVTVDSLAAPSEKLTLLNNLLADVYQLDKARGIPTASADSSELVDYHLIIQEKLETLKSKTEDTLEIKKLNDISYDVSELIVVYNGLEDVKDNLINRNFSLEALKNIETKIRRKEELNRLQNLGRIRLTNPSPPENNQKREITSSRNNLPINVLTEKERENMRELFGLLRVNLGRSDTTKLTGTSASDSVLYAVRNFVLDINNEERQLRSRLATLEADLNTKNRALIENIQAIISTLQDEALKVSHAQNRSAYDLTFDVGILLGILIIIGVIGSLGFIYSIITEINKAQLYSDQLEEAKKRSDNLAKAKQNFLANMSHEIRNPLHVIMGFNDAIAKTGLDERQKDYVKMVGFASDTLSAIVDDILDFSKLEAGKVNIEKQPFNPHKLFSSMHQFFKHRALDKNINFQFDVEIPKNHWFLGDELRINQILNNLLTNSIKFTEKGSVKVDIRYKDGELSLNVEDSGMGMSTELKNKIFTKFNQGDESITRKFGGTGLGLAIVKRLVDLQKGTINLESTVGVGTKITISLPIELVEPQEQDELTTITYSIKGLNVLVVDDDPIGIKFINLLLTGKGANVTSFPGGADFKTHFRGGTFDLALVDIQMPEVSGYEVLRILRNQQEYKDLTVLAITANVFAKEKEKLEEVGFDGLILKPFREEELLFRIAKALNLKPIADTKAVTENGQAQPGLPYDLTDLKKFCMEDEDMLEEVVIDFYSETLQNLIDLNKALDNLDYRIIREIAHKLSSRLGQLKINASKMARQLEEDLKMGRTDAVSQTVWQITKEVDETLTLLAADYKLTV